MTTTLEPRVTSTRVLFIDDDPADLAHWSRVLRDRSPLYSVSTASDGESGFHLYQSQNVDCVVLDLDLPDCSGFEVLFRLVRNRNCPSVGVVVLTHLTYHHLHEMVVHNGAHACLVKQCTSAEELDRAIQGAIVSRS